VPLQPPEIANEFPATDAEVENPVEDERIVPDATQDSNQDPTEMPEQELAEHDNPEPSPEAPAPELNFNTSLGLAGNFGGGQGGGERGGLIHARSRGRGLGKPPVPPENVEAAHVWLADHQNPEGLWSAAGFGDDSRRTGARKTYNREFVRPGDPEGDGGWDRSVDVGLTGLALLAFTGDLNTHKQGRYRVNVRRALTWLLRVQDNQGCFGPREDDHFVYNHAIATMAMAELYLITEDRLLRPGVARAVDFILRAQNPGLGWRYGVRPGNTDSSVTGWMVLTLHTARMAGIEFDASKSFEDAANWFKLVTHDAGGYPRTGYDSPGGNGARLRAATAYDNLPAMDAIHIMSMLFMHKAVPNDPVLRAQAGAITQELPQWRLEKLDFYYWYYASLALFQQGGSAWEKWERPLAQTLLNNQRGFGSERHESPATLDEHGSWDPIDAWGSAGGRVYATAINCLTLQVWYRYARMK